MIMVLIILGDNLGRSHLSHCDNYGHLCKVYAKLLVLFTYYIGQGACAYKSLILYKLSKLAQALHVIQHKGKHYW